MFLVGFFAILFCVAHAGLLSQVSVVGPSVICLYINDVPDIAFYSTTIFGDDTTVIYSLL